MAVADSGESGNGVSVRGESGGKREQGVHKLFCMMGSKPTSTWGVAELVNIPSNDIALFDAEGRPVRLRTSAVFCAKHARRPWRLAGSSVLLREWR